MIKIFIFAMAAAILPSRASAFSYLGFQNLGDPAYSGGAKSLSLGLTTMSSAKNASALFSNPASMTTSNGHSFYFSLPMAIISERIIPDSDWSGDTGGAYFNSNGYFEMPDAAFIYAFSKRVRLGIGMTQKMNFSYRHSEEFYSGGSYAGKFDYRGAGNIRSFDLAAALKLQGGWSWGVSHELLRGNPSAAANFIGATAASTVRTKREYSFSGSRTGVSLYRDRGLWNYGLSYLPRAGLDYDLKYTLDGSGIKYQGQLDLPRELAFGLQHVWSGAVSASLYFDIVKIYWSDMAFTDPATLEKHNYKDRLSYHLGVENDLSSTLQLRYGMAFIPSYERTSVERAYLTAGFGYYITSKMHLDMGYAYGRRNYLDSWQRGATSYQCRIQESTHMFNVSLDWRL